MPDCAPKHPPARLVEGPVHRHLIRLTVPMIWGLLAIMTFNVVDTFFVAQLGADELAAMSFTFPVVFVLISASIGLGAGLTSVLARAIGAGDGARVRRIATDGLLLALLVVLALTALGLATIDPLFTAMGANETLLPLIRDYMEIHYLGVVFLVVSMAAMSIIRASGDARIPGLLLSGSAILNIILDPLLIFGLLGFPRLEMAGAAIATVIARAASFAIALWVLQVKLHLITLARPTWSELRRSWAGILHVGLPATGTNVIIPLATGVLIAMLARFGPEAVAGFGAATRIEALTLVVFYAISAIIGAFVGQNLGAGKIDRIYRAMWLCAVFAFAFGAAIAVLLAIFAEPLGRLFSAEAAVIEVAARYLWIVPLSYGGAGVVMIVNAAFNGAGLPGKAVVVSVLRMVVVLLPAAWLGALLIGVEGVFAAVAFSNLMIGIGAYFWYQRTCEQLTSARRAAPLPGAGPAE